MTFTDRYLTETSAILGILDATAIERIAEELASLKARRGRLFIIGVGGSAATASHAVNDFRKITHIEAYTPTDNVAELTARTNDDGWETTFSSWLCTSRIDADDALLVLSVGGGSKTTSANIVDAIDYAKDYGATILGIVGRDGGHTAAKATACLVIPPAYKARITPHTEGVASVVLHLLVSHPLLCSA
jgi:D-sedoheptulose 7-phosphate isomerase